MPERVLMNVYVSDEPLRYAGPSRLDGGPWKSNARWQ